MERIITITQLFFIVCKRNSQSLQLPYEHCFVGGNYWHSTTLTIEAQNIVHLAYRNLTDHIWHIWHTQFRQYNFPFLILNSRPEIPSTRQYFPSFNYIITLELYQIKTILTFVSALHTVNLTIPTTVYLGIKPQNLNDDQCCSHSASHTRELCLTTVQFHHHWSEGSHEWWNPKYIWSTDNTILLLTNPTHARYSIT